MAEADDPKTYGRARLSFADQAEIDEFASVLGQFERGEIGPDAWRAFRLVRGTYGQRQAIDAQMLRVKMPQGILDGAQLEALADVADRYSRGFGHITTRQNVQFHFMRLHDVELAMRRLAEAGLTTREACGSAVRNITACQYSGVSRDEVFDVTPYAEALTRHLLRHPLSSKLPRKFKIGFEGCATDHAKIGINDLGFKALISNGHRAFRITVAGGTSILPRSGALLHEALPAGEIFDVADAVIRVFAAFGDYQHKQRNRLKFLIKSMGWERWHEEYLKALDGVRSEPGREFPFDPEAAPVELAPPDNDRVGPDLAELAIAAAAAKLRGPGILPVHPAPGGSSFAAWRETNVRLQKQDGFAVATATVPLGDVTAAQLRLLGCLANAFGDGSVRVTTEQNVVFRWVPIDALEDLHSALDAVGLSLHGVDTLADVVSCPGAETCRLAVTQSRGLGRMLGDHLRTSPAIAAAGGPADIKISGCPNGCGQHHVAAIGFQGSIRRVDGQAIPQYFVMAGGGSDETGASFGRIVAKVPARRCTEAVDRLVAVFAAERADGETLAAFLRRADPAHLKATLRDLEDDITADDFVDLGEEHAFAPEVLEGECSA